MRKPWSKAAGCVINWLQVSRHPLRVGSTIIITLLYQGNKSYSPFSLFSAKAINISDFP
jgi:hypothetical protein